jgi:oligopeptidase A
MPPVELISSPAATPAGADDNPLLQELALPAFHRLDASHVAPALDRLLAEAEAALERAVSDAVPADYEEVSAALGITPVCRASPISTPGWARMSACTASTARSRPRLKRPP